MGFNLRFQLLVLVVICLMSMVCALKLCTADFRPVCGSDGNTYGNFCNLEVENERRELEGLDLLTMICNKACERC